MVKLVGILNITPDSFSDGGLYLDSEKALNQLENLIREGAEIIDLGAESTRPGAPIVTAEAELARLKPLLPKLENLLKGQNKKIALSIDSRRKIVIEAALKHGFTYVNDVSANSSIELLKIIKKAKAKVIFSHNLGIPAAKERVLPGNIDIISEICRWAEIWVIHVNLFWLL